MKTYLILFLSFIVTLVNGQGVIGKWKTIDDETGKDKSIVELYMKDGKLCGKIIKIFKVLKRPLTDTFDFSGFKSLIPVSIKLHNNIG